MDILSMTLEQLKELETELKGQVPSDVVELNRVQSRITELEQQAEQQKAAQVRIQDATEQAAYFLDNLVIEGLTMRELCVDEPQYQMLRIAVQNKIINLAEENSKQISDVQAEETAQKNALKKQIDELEGMVEAERNEAFEDHETIKQLRVDLSQARSEVTDYQGKLKNATDEIDRLNSHVDDLRKEIAVGARNAYKVIDSEEQSKQMKELADKIKASRIYVYDVVPDDVINPRSYTAKRADDGTDVKYNWTQAKNYVELKDPNEVQQFRDQHASHQEAVSNPPLVQPVQDSVTPPTAPEATFPVPSAIPPEVPHIPATETVDLGHASTTGESGKTVEERLSALEAHVFGYVKQAS